jgi:PAS domain S-box-containing protein
MTHDILIVEDNPVTRQMVRLTLEQRGYSVNEASTGAAALTSVSSTQYSLVILDLFLPDADGIDLVSRLRALPGAKNIPILAFSGLQSRMEEARLLRAPFTDYIFKPVEPARLCAIVAQHLERGVVTAGSSGNDAPRVARDDTGRPSKQVGGRDESNDALLRRGALDSVLLSVLTGTAMVLATTSDLKVVMADALARVLDASGLSSGAVFVTNEYGRPQPIAVLGGAGIDVNAVATLFDEGSPLHAMAHGAAPVRIRSRDVAAAAGRIATALPYDCWLVVAPILGKGKSLGALVTCSADAEMSEEWLGSAQAVANQLGMAIALSRTIDDLVRSRDATRDNEQRFRALVETSFDAIAVSADGRFREVNRGFLDMFGFVSADEIIGRPVLDVVAEESRAEVEHRVRNSVTGPYEIVGKRCDGKRIQVELTANMHAFDGGRARITALRDVTEKRRLEDQFRQAQKMEAVGRLAGGVAHDFNNMLTVIMGNTELLLADLMPGDPRGEDLQQIRKAAEGATHLTRQLLMFSRQQVIEPRTIVLAEAVELTRKMLTHLIGEDIAIDTEHHDPSAAIHIDPGQLEQVLMNIAVNARDAMPTGGKLTIETRMVSFDAHAADLHDSVTPGAFVLLAMTDTGTGMDAATQARIFEPFFTTKEPGKGTGLGLATVYGIVKQAGGAVTAYSEPGIGTSFKIYFPIASDLSVPEIDAAKGMEPPSGTETVLLVEDSANVRGVARRALSRSGYVVMESESPLDALAQASRPGRRIDLLLTDVVMPNMSGRVLAERFAELHPNAKVLFMSGYTDDAIVRHGVLTSSMPYLQKPFTPGALARRVREVLDVA